MKRCVLVLLVVAGCASAQRGGTEDVKGIIDRTNKDIAMQYARGDVDAVVSHFSESAWQMPPNQPPSVGREAIRQYWRQAVQWGKWEFSFDVQTVDVSGNMAIERGKYTLRFTAGANAPFPSLTDHGNYLVEWRRDADGQWRAVADAPVSDVALAPPK